MEIILMDLDGTITNPKEGITKSVQYSLKKMGIEIQDLDSLVKHIGPPLKDGFMEYYGFTESEAQRAVEFYREYYKEIGIRQNEAYDGMEQLLIKLKQAGKTLIVATSKPEPLAVEVLDYFHLSNYFDDICGASFDDTRASKEAVIRYALEKNGIKDLDSVVMIGDRCYDIIGAKAVGIPSIGVLYGFGDREELESAQADYIVAKVTDLFDTIMNL